MEYESTESVVGSFKWSDAIKASMVPFNIDIMMANIYGGRFNHARAPFPIILQAPELEPKPTKEGVDETEEKPMRPKGAGWTLGYSDTLIDVGLMSLIEQLIEHGPDTVDTMTITLSTSRKQQDMTPTSASAIETRTLRELAAPRVYGTWRNILPCRPAGYLYGASVFEGAPMYNNIGRAPPPLQARGFSDPRSVAFARHQVILLSRALKMTLVKPEPVDFPEGLPPTGPLRNAAEIKAISTNLRSLARLIAWQWPLVTARILEPLIMMALDDAKNRGYTQFIDRVTSLLSWIKRIPLCPDALGLISALTNFTVVTLEGSGPGYAYPYDDFEERALSYRGRTFRMLDYLPWQEELLAASQSRIVWDAAHISIFALGEALSRVPASEFDRMQRIAGHLGWSGSATNFGRCDLRFDKAHFVVTDGDHVSEARPDLLLGTTYILPVTSRHRTVLPTHKLMSWAYATLPIPMSEDPWEPWRHGFSDKVIPVWASMGEIGAEELDYSTVEEALAITGVRPLGAMYTPRWPNDPGASDFPTGGTPVEAADPRAAFDTNTLVGQDLNPGDKMDLFLFTGTPVDATEARTRLGRGDPKGRVYYRGGGTEVFATRSVVRRCYAPVYLPMQAGGTWLGDPRPAFTRWEAGIDATSSRPTSDLGSALLSGLAASIVASSGEGT